VRARAYYANLWRSIERSVALPVSLEEELTDRRIEASAGDIIPRVNGQFCNEVRSIAAFLHGCWNSRPPSETRQELKDVQNSVQLCRDKLAGLSPFSRATLGELSDVGAMSASADPVWELDDPVAPLLEDLEALGERLDARLPLIPRGGRPPSPKEASLWLLHSLVVEHKGSCNQRELLRLASAYLGPVLLLHDDVTDLRDHVRKVIKEARQMQGKTT